MGDNSWQEHEASLMEKGLDFKKPYPVKFSQPEALTSFSHSDTLFAYLEGKGDSDKVRHDRDLIEATLEPLNAAASTKVGGIVNLSEEQVATMERTLLDYLYDNKIHSNSSTSMELNKQRIEIVRKYKDAKKGHNVVARAVRERVEKMMGRGQK